MTQSHDNNLVEQFIGGMIGIGWFLLYVLISAFILSKWLTNLFFKFVVNPLLRGALDRQDGLVVMLSGSLWSVLFVILYMWLLYPQLDFRSPEEKLQAFWLFLGLGLVWGVAIAGWLLLEWWSEAQMVLEPVYEPQQMLGQGVKIVSAPSADVSRSLPSKEELEHDLAGISQQEKQAF